MLRSVIIEDSITSRQCLENLLQELCPDKVTVVGYGECYTSGIDSIRRAKPDVVFLDIELPGGTGFDILEALEEKERTFAVICTTDWIKYAYQAIKDGVIAFLTKPIDMDELIAAVEKASLDREKETALQRVRKNRLLLDFLESSQSPSPHIILKIQKEDVLVPLYTILYCESDHKYTIFHLTDGEDIRMRKNLCDFEDFLKVHGFIRINRSTIVNLHHIVSSSFNIALTKSIGLSNNTILSLSRICQEDVLKSINAIRPV